MQEDFLHYLWKYGLFPSNQLVAQNGERVEVLHNGQHNRDAGPDFLFARIKIDKTVWVGHVEIHVKASDWYRHRHEADPAYETVVLHVVYEQDCEVRRSNGEVIPSVRLAVKQDYLTNYHRILSTLSPIPCETAWMNLPSLEVENWLINMGIERMEVKTQEILSRLAENRGGWDETLFQLAVRTFGFGVNQDVFDRLGRSLPLPSIRYAGSNQFRLEAFLFGQSGMVPVTGKEPYVRALYNEYAFLRRKFNLTTLEKPGWKFLRMRPSNFPTVRIAQLAAFIAVNDIRPATLVEKAGSLEQDPWEISVSSYWKTHYDFTKTWSGNPPGIGAGAINLMKINLFLPFLSCYESRLGRSDSRVNWMEQLEKLPPEDNRITRLWCKYGYQVPNAFYSQAFLHLYNEYCRPRNCLNCRIGQTLISNRIS